MAEPNPRTPAIHVWLLAVDAVSPGYFSACASLLDSAEQLGAERFHERADRRAYVLAHGLLRHALSREGGVPAADWRFQTEPGGRPRLDPAQGHAELRFSLSHTRGLVACATTWAGAIGVDVESLERVAALREAAGQFLAAEETAEMATCRPADLPDFLAATWTLKEAMLKARGLGLAGDPRRIHLQGVLRGPPQWIMPPPGGVASDWQLHTQLVHPRHRLAVAWQRGGMADRPIKFMAADFC